MIYSTWYGMTVRHLEAKLPDDTKQNYNFRDLSLNPYVIIILDMSCPAWSMLRFEQFLKWSIQVQGQDICSNWTLLSFFFISKVSQLRLVPASPSARGLTACYLRREHRTVQLQMWMAKSFESGERCIHHPTFSKCTSFVEQLANADLWNLSANGTISFPQTTSKNQLSNRHS